MVFLCIVFLVLSHTCNIRLHLHDRMEYFYAYQNVVKTYIPVVITMSAAMVIALRKAEKFAQFQRYNYN